MNALTNPKAAQIAAELEGDIGVLVPALDGLLSRVTGSESTVVEFDRTSIRLVAPLSFPDDLGHGDVVASLFHYRDQVRLDVEIEHDRMFARPDGTASERENIRSRSEEHTSELQSRPHLVCRLLLEKKKKKTL